MKVHAPKAYVRRLQMMQKSGTHLKEMDMLQEEEHVCLNCNTTYVGRFCPHCGQKANIKRLSFSEALENLVGIFTNFERGFLHTCIDLCYRPGHMIRDYIRGHRVEYIQPVKLLFLLGTIYLMEHYLLFQEWMNKPEVREGKLSKAVDMNFWEPIINYLDNPPAEAIMLITVMVFPNYLFFKKSPFGQSMNYAEHFYAMVFVSCQLFILAILSMPINGLIGYEYIDVEELCILLIVLDFYQLMGLKFWKTVRQCLKSVLLGALIAFILIVLVSSIAVGLYFVIKGALPNLSLFK